MVQNGPKWSNMVKYDLIWFNMVQMLSLRSSKCVRHNQVSWSSFLLINSWLLIQYHMARVILYIALAPGQQKRTICTIWIKCILQSLHTHVANRTNYKCNVWPFFADIGSNSLTQAAGMNAITVTAATGAEQNQ